MATFQATPSKKTSLRSVSASVCSKELTIISKWRAHYHERFQITPVPSQISSNIRWQTFPPFPYSSPSSSIFSLRSYFLRGGRLRIKIIDLKIHTSLFFAPKRSCFWLSKPFFELYVVFDDNCSRKYSAFDDKWSKINGSKTKQFFLSLQCDEKSAHNITNNKLCKQSTVFLPKKV